MLLFTCGSRETFSAATKDAESEDVYVKHCNNGENGKLNS